MTYPQHPAQYPPPGASPVPAGYPPQYHQAPAPRSSTALVVCLIVIAVLVVAVIVLLVLLAQANSSAQVDDIFREVGERLESVNP